MLFGRSDIPTERDSVGRFLPWIVSFMVYLSILAVAGVLAMSSMTGRWNHGLSGTLTIQLPPLDDRVADERRLAAIVDLLRQIPDVGRIDVLARDRVMALLEPWLGPASAVEGMPLPRLIDVELRSGARVDTQALTRRLDAVVSGVTVDDHRVWLERLIELVTAAQGLAIAILILLGGATVGTVIFITRTGLAIHRDVIEVLHLIGAQDSYIARQFADRALALGLKGGLVGLGLAIPTLIGAGLIAGRLDTMLIPDVSLAPIDWLLLASIPFVAAAIAHIAARVTVTRVLAEML